MGESQLESKGERFCIQPSLLLKPWPAPLPDVSDLEGERGGGASVHDIAFASSPDVDFQVWLVRFQGTRFFWDFASLPFHRGIS
jgi:hypothetical protein